LHWQVFVFLFVMEEKKVRKILDSQQALIRAQKYCAYQERSQQEVRDKLYSFGLHSGDVENAITELITSGFLKEERFAFAFAGGKFRAKGWGRIKIKQALKQKCIPEYLIKQSLKAINERDYIKTLKKIIEEKTKKVKEKNSLKKNYKVAQYAISRGFEAELVWELINEKEVP
jgi:regulatory protein